MLIRFNHVNLANNYVVGSTFRLNDKPCAAPSSLSRKQKLLLQGNYNYMERICQFRKLSQIDIPFRRTCSTVSLQLPIICARYNRHEVPNSWNLNQLSHGDIVLVLEVANFQLLRVRFWISQSTFQTFKLHSERH